MSKSILPSPESERTEFKKRFPYGRRFVKRPGPNGQVELDQVPLTLEDVLHPQEGDVIPEIPRHNQEREYLRQGLRACYPNDPSVEVFSDCLVDWGVEDLRDTSPDISVFFGVKNQHDPLKGTFHLAESGGHPVLVIELVSIDTRKNDVVAKVEEYHQAGVPFYVIVDQQREDGPREIIGYRYTPGRFERLALDDHGRLQLGPFPLVLGLEENWVALYEVTAGSKVGSYVEIRQQLSSVTEQLKRESEARRAAEERIRELEEMLRRRNGQQE